MKKVQAHIRTNRLEAVKAALEDIGVLGMSVTETRGFGRQQGRTETFRGSAYALNLVPKLKIEIIVADEMLDEVIDAIIQTTQTGELGDGKIFVSEVLDAVRIRTGERGNSALE
ncbi:P-II family nitrogen regulator [Kamptonema cortianum]|nr:P-II family nitrogen regulator [Geitlerinema splendidum]MDK3156159.1 P-II family nitrogen regulator [Kamptonema cortianum]